MPAGKGVVALVPIARISPFDRIMVASVIGGAPVPSMTFTCVSAIRGALKRMKPLIPYPGHAGNQACHSGRKNNQAATTTVKISGMFFQRMWLPPIYFPARSKIALAAEIEIGTEDAR